MEIARKHLTDLLLKPLEFVAGAILVLTIGLPFLLYLIPTRSGNMGESYFDWETRRLEAFVVGGGGCAPVGAGGLIGHVTAFFTCTQAPLTAFAEHTLVPAAIIAALLFAFPATRGHGLPIIGGLVMAVLAGLWGPGVIDWARSLG